MLSFQSQSSSVAELKNNCCFRFLSSSIRFVLSLQSAQTACSRSWLKSAQTAWFRSWLQYAPNCVVPFLIAVCPKLRVPVPVCSPPKLRVPAPDCSTPQLHNSRFQSCSDGAREDVDDGRFLAERTTTTENAGRTRLLDRPKISTNHNVWGFQNKEIYCTWFFFKLISCIWSWDPEKPLICKSLVTVLLLFCLSFLLSSSFHS